MKDYLTGSRYIAQSSQMVAWARTEAKITPLTPDEQEHYLLIERLRDRVLFPYPRLC